MKLNPIYTKRLARQGIDLSTCINLRFVYSKLKNGSGELTEKDRNEVRVALQKISNIASNAISRICIENSNPDSLEQLIEKPQSLNNAIKELFNRAYNNYLWPEEQNFIHERLCHRAGHKKQDDHRHFDEDVCKNITAFYELLLYRYTCSPPASMKRIVKRPEEIAPPRDSLVREFSERALKDPDIWAFEFFDFLEPNETTPGLVKEHLTNIAKGLIVSVGTERSLFDLLFAPEQCTGLVVVDVNPRVKAYNDFNLLLICLSANHEEYVELSKPLSIPKHNGKKFEDRIFKIQEKLINAPLPTCVKDYYQRNLFSFGIVYFTEKRLWRNARMEGINYLKTAVNGFAECRYDQNPDQFNKIQAYAKRGDIISVVGAINDLTFLNRPISVVDISNVADHVFTNIKGIQDETRVIWTNLMQSQKGYFFTYASYVQSQEKIDEKEHKLLNYFFNWWMKNKLEADQQTPLDLTNSIWNAYYKMLMLKRPGANKQEILKHTLTKPIGAFYSRSSLKFLKKQFKIAVQNTN